MAISNKLKSLYNKVALALGVAAEFTEALPDCYEAVEDKGGTLPAQQTAANLPSAIASIPSGGEEDAFESYYPYLFDPLKELEKNISAEYPSGICYVVPAGIDIDIPTADKVVFADGTIGASGTAQTIPVSSNSEKACTYIICLYSSRATITELMNNTNSLAIGVKNADIPSIDLTSASNLLGFLADNCLLGFTVRYAAGLYLTYWKDTNCTYSITAQWSNIWRSTMLYLYTDANWDAVTYNSEIIKGAKINKFVAPNLTGDYLAGAGNNTPFLGSPVFKYVSFPKANCFPNFRNGTVNNVILGKITLQDDWTMNTISGLKYLEVGEDTDVNMTLQNSHIYTDSVSSQSGIAMLNKNLVLGIGNKIKDNSGTGVTRVITLPSSVFAVLTNDTKAVFTNKGWTIAGA